VVRVKEGNVPADDIGDDSDSTSESDEDEDGVVWARSGVEKLRHTFGGGQYRGM